MTNKILTILVCLILMASQSFGALEFTGGDGDVVSHTSNSTIDNLEEGTICIWFIFAAHSGVFRHLFDKRKSGSERKHLQLTNTPSYNVELIMATGLIQTTATFSSFAHHGFGKYIFLAFTWNSAGTAGEQQLAIGDLSNLAELPSSYSSQTVGSGGVVDDSGAVWDFGGSSVLSNNSIDGKISFVRIENVVHTLSEIQALQFNFKKTVNTVLLSHYGFNGTGTQTDYSGNGNSGTVTGATIADHAPLPAPFGG